MSLRRVTQIRAFAGAPRVPPTEIQLWNVGDNATDYGVHKWTERSAEEVLATYQARGNPLQIDVEHNAATAPANAGDIGPTGGYARLELRSGAPWLVFDWSTFAVEQIETGQRRFLSPEYDVDKQTGEIVRLVRVSLVGDPGTHNARMLASAARRVRAGGQNMNLAMLLAALKAANAMEDPEAAKTAMANLIAELEKAAGGEGGTEEPGEEEAAAPPGDPAKEPAKAAAPDAPPGDDDAKKREAAAAPPAPEADPKKATAAKKPAAAPAVDVVLANRVAALEAQVAETEAENRFVLASDRIPESLHEFARTLAKSKDAFDQFVKGLPEGKLGQRVGVRAAARAPLGDPRHIAGRPEGALPTDDAKVMARVFQIDKRPEESVTELADGRIRATHMARPKTAVGGQK